MHRGVCKCFFDSFLIEFHPCTDPPLQQSIIAVRVHAHTKAEDSDRFTPRVVTEAAQVVHARLQVSRVDANYVLHCFRTEGGPRTSEVHVRRTMCVEIRDGVLGIFHQCDQVERVMAIGWSDDHRNG